MDQSEVLQHQELYQGIFDEYTDIRMVTTKQLQEILGVSYKWAVRIGAEAGARFQIGDKLIRWRVKNIREYLDKMQEAAG